jgi:hypothetical protein
MNSNSKNIIVFNQKIKIAFKKFKKHKYNNLKNKTSILQNYNKKIQKNNKLFNIFK